MKKCIFTLCALLLISCSSTSEKEMNKRDQEQISPVQDESTSMVNEDLEGTDFVESEESVQVSKMYQVESGDTYMWIAYKLYGDYRRWRELAAANPGMGSKQLKVGTKIEYIVPQDEYSWEEEGASYRIQPGDSLTKISRKLYGDSTLWTNLWENNKRMIDEPNLIFSGFTLFYQDVDVDEDEFALK